MRLAQVLGLILLVAVVGLSAGAAGAWWVLRNATAMVPLDGQALQARLPANLPVKVTVLEGQGLDGDGARGIPVRLAESLELDVHFDTEVPLALTVRYQGIIPVNTEVPVETTMDTRVLGVPMTLPISGRIPLNLDLPVDLEIPISQPVKLAFSAPISADIDQIIHIPLQAELDTQIHFGDTPLPLTVQQSTLALPLDEVWLRGEADSDWQLGPLRPKQ